MSERMVRTGDGVELATRRHGSGASLLLVHGSSTDRECFGMAEPALGEHHRVISYDRRGRGRSGDGHKYSIEAEVEDLCAVLDTVGPSHVVGHSFGAVCALLATRRGAPVQTLVLYEPPLRMDRNPADVARRAFDESGAVEQRIAAFHQLCGITEDERDIMRSIPTVWESQVRGMATVTREARALESLRWTTADWSGISVPVCFLRGERNAAPVYLTPDEIRTWFPSAAIEELPGQGHLAFAFAPDAFAEAIVGFTARR